MLQAHLLINIWEYLGDYAEIERFCQNPILAIDYLFSELKARTRKTPQHASKSTPNCCRAHRKNPRESFKQAVPDGNRTAQEICRLAGTKKSV